MNIKLLSKDEINELSKNITIEIDESNIQHFLHFHYFSPSNISGDYEQFYICAFNNNELVGILKIAKSYIHNDFSIAYIDIRKDFKNNGISKLLLSYLNNYLQEKTHILIYCFSREAKSISFNTKIYSYLNKLLIEIS